MAKIGRNDPCPCGSGLKAKHCCLAHGPEDAAFILATQEAPMAKLAARWLSAVRRRDDHGQPPDDLMRRRAEQFLRVCRGWSPDAFNEDGAPSGALPVLAAGFGGRAKAVFGALAIGLAHLLLEQPDAAHDWLAALTGRHEEQTLAYLTEAGLPTRPFAGLAARYVPMGGDQQPVSDSNGSDTA